MTESVTPQGRMDRNRLWKKQTMSQATVLRRFGEKHNIDGSSFH